MKELRTALARVIVAGNDARQLPSLANVRDLLARQIEFDALLVDELGKIAGDRDSALTAAIPKE